MNTTFRQLTVTFDTPLHPWELVAFRGAVAQKAGYQHEHYHNHNNETGGYHYRLPLIQYKQERGRAMLVCLNEGIEELQHFFSQPDWMLHLNGRPAPVRIERLGVQQHSLAPVEQPHRYHIRHWIGLNEDNYATYTRLTGLIERLFFLEKILQNQLVGLLAQLGQTADAPIALKLLEMKDERWVSYKKVKMLAFSIVFEVNLLLPDYIGLGKGCSTGWGVVKRLK